MDQFKMQLEKVFLRSGVGQETAQIKAPPTVASAKLED
jgi:hypothetical protein